LQNVSVSCTSLHSPFCGRISLVTSCTASDLIFCLLFVPGSTD
jgi:hypothetical protein